MIQSFAGFVALASMFAVGFMMFVVALDEINQ
jgi:hypothetical protein